jgi:hypothetical protein
MEKGDIQLFRGDVEWPLFLARSFGPWRGGTTKRGSVTRYHKTWCEIAVGRAAHHGTNQVRVGSMHLSTSGAVMKSLRGGSPNRFRWSLRGLMGAIVITALWLAMLVPTVGARVDSSKPRADDLFVAGGGMDRHYNGSRFLGCGCQASPNPFVAQQFGCPDNAGARQTLRPNCRMI